MIYLLTGIGLTPGGSSTVHIYTKTIHRTKLTTSVGRLSGIRTQSLGFEMNSGRLTKLMRFVESVVVALAVAVVVVVVVIVIIIMTLYVPSFFLHFRLP